MTDKNLGQTMTNDGATPRRWGYPKRTTLGKYTLEILPPEWSDFVEFHVKQLGCDYCRANLLELSEEIDANDNERTSQQMFQSTIGFLDKPSVD